MLNCSFYTGSEWKKTCISKLVLKTYVKSSIQYYLRQTNVNILDAIELWSKISFQIK